MGAIVELWLPVFIFGNVFASLWLLLSMKYNNSALTLWIQSWRMVRARGKPKERGCNRSERSDSSYVSGGAYSRRNMRIAIHTNNLVIEACLHLRQ